MAFRQKIFVLVIVCYLRQHCCYSRSSLLSLNFVVQGKWFYLSCLLAVLLIMITDFYQTIATSPGRARHINCCSLQIEWVLWHHYIARIANSMCGGAVTMQLYLVLLAHQPLPVVSASIALVLLWTEPK